MRGLLAGACLAVVTAAPVAAAERILDFRSDITVARDSTVTVAETIRVRAEGNRIRRGIYRDFPTEYTDRAGRRVSVGFDVESVTRDGRAEPFRLERLGNGVRVYIGDQDVLLGPGEHTYRIAYRTDRQLGFFERHDELYWNVTGNGWAFAIVAAAASVRLPPDVSAAAVAVEAYTGPAGARGRDFRAEVRDGVPEFATTRTLAPGEGLTIVVTWPKGHVSPPGDAQRAAYLMRDNRPLAWALSGFAALLAYYLFAWFRVGRDPAPGLVVPRYEPPEETSPAAMRYLKRMRYDDRCFAAGVLGLAVKGHLTIEQEPAGVLGSGGQYTLEKRDGGGVLAADEDELLRHLFHGADRLELKNDNHARVSSARSRHQESLRRRYVSSFFRINGGWHALGVLLSLAVAAAATVGAGVWHGFGPEWFFTTAGGWGTFGAIAAGFVANGVFGLLLKAPTVAGRKVMDAIEGFRLYLDVAEGDELKLAGAPRKTPSLFERYLPYALALGVEQRWAERFAAVFAAAGAAATPGWYHGERWDAGRLGRFSSSLGSSLESAIASSATAPGSSSGSGGGGSSGGGGGGGGGGGW